LLYVILVLISYLYYFINFESIKADYNYYNTKNMEESNNKSLLCPTTFGKRCPMNMSIKLCKSFELNIPKFKYSRQLKMHVKSVSLYNHPI